MLSYVMIWYVMSCYVMLQNIEGVKHYLKDNTILKNYRRVCTEKLKYIHYTQFFSVTSDPFKY